MASDNVSSNIWQALARGAPRIALIGDTVLCALAFSAACAVAGGAATAHCVVNMFLLFT